MTLADLRRKYTDVYEIRSICRDKEKFFTDQYMHLLINKTTVQFKGLNPSSVELMMEYFDTLERLVIREIDELEGFISDLSNLLRELLIEINNKCAEEFSREDQL